MIRKTYRIRLLALLMLPLVLATVLAVRAYMLQVVHHEYYQRKADRQQRVGIPIRPRRGAIMTSDGVELAISTPAYAVYSETRLITARHDELARRLSVILRRPEDRLRQLLESGRVVTLARKVDRRTRERIEDLTSEFRMHRFAIHFEEEGKRHYPRATLASHLVGFVTLDEFGDNDGIAGVELSQDENLRGSLELFEAARTAVSKRLEPISEDAWRRAFGDSVVLTINSAIQHMAELALEEVCLETQALGAVAIVSEVKTGRILALANYPTYDVNQFSSATFDQMRNRAVADSIEPGSVIKTVAMAILFDAGLITPESEFDCNGGRLRINGRMVVDAPGHRLYRASIREIFKYSSNVGTNLAAQLIEPALYDAYLRRFGFGQSTNSGIHGEVAGILKPLSQHSGFTMTSLPMGYEINSTALQMVQAIGAIANGGVMMRPYVVEEIYDHSWRLKQRIEPQRVHRPIGAFAAAQTLSIMEDTVVSGTGKRAAIPGYRIGGKTGTTHKYMAELRGYSPRNYIASFCGVFPLSDPEILIYVYVDDPQGRKYGGDVAAPVFRRIAEEVIRVRAIRPDIENYEAAPADTGRGIARARNRRLERAAQAEAAAATPAPPMHGRAEALPAESDLSDEVEQPEESVERHVRHLPMPDLMGLSMPEARAALADFKPRRLQFEGSGFVISQMPPAEALVPQDSAIVLVFGHP